MKTTNELEWVKSRIASRIGKLETAVTEYRKQMELDFERFFHDYAGQMYSTGYELKAYHTLSLAIQDMDQTEAEEYIRATIMMLTNELLEMPLEKNSTNRMANIGFSLQLKVKQKLREYYIRLLGVLEDTESHQLKKS